MASNAEVVEQGNARNKSITPSNMKLLVVFNPGAAHGRARRRLEDIRAALGAAGIEATVMLTEAPGNANQMVRSARLDAWDGIAAAGGDGTLFEALNGLMAHATSARRPLGLIPLGTGNAFSRDLGLDPGDWRRGIEAIARGHTRRVDVAQLDHVDGRFHFLNIAGIGFVADAGRVSARLKFTGPAAYTLGTLWCCLRLRSHDLAIEVDGKPIQQDSLFLEVSNSRYTGTSFLMAPDARIDDGRLDVILARHLPRRRLLRLFPSIYSGRHVEYEEVTALTGRSIQISSPAGLEFMVDGEISGRTPARIDCLPGAIEMFASKRG